MKLENPRGQESVRIPHFESHLNSQVFFTCPDRVPPRLCSVPEAKDVWRNRVTEDKSTIQVIGTLVMESCLSVFLQVNWEDCEDSSTWQSCKRPGLGVPSSRRWVTRCEQCDLMLVQQCSQCSSFQLNCGHVATQLKDVTWKTSTCKSFCAQVPSFPRNAKCERQLDSSSPLDCNRTGLVEPMVTVSSTPCRDMSIRIRKSYPKSVPPKHLAANPPGSLPGACLSLDRKSWIFPMQSYQSILSELRKLGSVEGIPSWVRSLLEKAWRPLPPLPAKIVKSF